MVNKWISVKKRLPKEKGYYIVCAVPISLIVSRPQERFFDPNEKNILWMKYVTHWTPIPKLPNWLPSAKIISDLIIFTTGIVTIWDYPKPDWVNCWYKPASSSRNNNGGFNHWCPIFIYGKIKFDVDTINLHAIANSYGPDIGHPSPKPIKLFQWLLEKSTKISNVVFDPFLGSGTTAVACEKLNRRWIGCEISEKYCEIAKERILRESQQIKMNI